MKHFEIALSLATVGIGLVIRPTRNNRRQKFQGGGDVSDLRGSAASWPHCFRRSVMRSFQLGLKNACFVLSAFSLVLHGGAALAAASILPQSAPSLAIVGHPWPNNFQASPYQSMNGGQSNSDQSHGSDPSPSADGGFVPLLDALEKENAK